MSEPSQYGGNIILETDWLGEHFLNSGVGRMSSVIVSSQLSKLISTQRRYYIT